MKKTKPRITGLGGIFFKVKNPTKLCGWYKKHLGLPISAEWCGCSFDWRAAARPKKKGSTIWSAFESGTKYFGKSKQGHMINYRVASLKKLLALLKKEGVWVDPKTEESEFGKFGWIKAGEGNRIELWEPPKGQ